MRRLKSAGLAVATLCLCLNPTISTVVSPAIAQTVIVQNHKAEGDRATLEDAKRLLEQGNKQLDTKEFQAALRSFQQALGVYQGLKNRSGEGQAYRGLGRASRELKQYESAIAYHQKTLEIAREIGDRELELKALSNFVLTYAALQNNTKVVEFAQPASTLAQKLKERVNEGLILALLADAYASLSENKKAIEVGQQALTIAKELKNLDIEALASYALAKAYKDLEPYDQAINFAQRSLLIAQKSQDSGLELLTLNLLGRLYGELEGRDKDAESAIQKGLVIARRSKNYRLEIELLITASVNAQLNDDYKKAIDFAKQGFALTQKHKVYEVEPHLVTQLFDLYSDLAAYREMADLAQRLLQFGKESDNSLLTAVGWMYLAWAQFGQGQQQEAFTSSQQVVATAKEIENPLVEAAGIFLLSFGYGNTKDYEQALTLSKQGLTIVREFGDSNMESGFLELQGGVYYKSGQFKQSIEVYRAALELDEESSSAKSSLARVYRDMNMPITAITYYKQAINKVEKERKSIRNLSSDLQASFLQTIEGVGNVRSIDAYRELADLLLSQGRLLEAQQVLELLKTQEVQDFTRSDKRQPNPQLEFALQEGKISAKSNSLIALGQQVDECEQKTCAQLKQLLDQRDMLVQQFDSEVQAIEKEFRDRNIRNTDDASLAPKDFLPQAESIVEAQPGTVLIYPLVMENRTWLLWASRGVVVKRQEVPGVGQKQIGETVLKLRQLLQNPNSDMNELKATSKQLYDWLIKPIESELTANDIRNLVFSLDRATRYIPMAALFDGEKFLLERYTVSTVLSAGYTDMSDRLPFAPQNTNVLALGMSQAKDGFDPLPNVPTELDAIVRQGNNSKTGVYDGQKLLNSAFTFPALRQNLGKQRIVHIATHGKFVPVNPDQSFLLLGDGRLEIPRIRTLQNLRNIDLVVLSACETALGGADQDGVEIAGISSYFLQRGRAKAVMASLWQVNDASTSLLMQQFYKNLANTTQSATKAEALRQAQLRMLRGEITAKDALKRSPEEARVEVRSSGKQPAANFSHPYYWAPFILIGNSL